jgi:glycosyltransferase involved in cell wall biosynthesis
MPVVSVVTCTYNRCHLLPRAVESVLDQTYEDFELVIIDDGSTDDTREVVNSYDDDRIKYIRHETNRGGVAARNTGIKSAEGDFIAILDDDDSWEPEKLEQQIAKFEDLNKEYGLVYTGRIIQEEDKTITTRPTYKGDIYEQLLRKNFIPSETVLVRSECFDELGLFDDSFRSCIDWDMWTRISREYKFSYVDKVLATTYRDSPHRQSDDKDGKLQGHRRYLKKHRDELISDAPAMSKMYMRIGVDKLWLGHQSCSLWFLRAFLRYPLSKTPLIRFGISLLPNRQRLYRRVYG